MMTLKIWIEKTKIMQIMKKKGYKRSSAWGKGISSNIDFIGRLGAMHSDVHSHDDRIVDCRIVYVIFLIVVKT